MRLDKGLFYWELKKLPLAIITLLVCIATISEIVICKFLCVGKYENINAEIYKSYIEKMSLMSSAEQFEYIEAEGADIVLTISSYGQKSEDYAKGKITAEAYSDYLAHYKECNAKSATFDKVSEKYRYVSSDKSLRLSYDLELDGYLSNALPNYPLLICIIIISGLMFIPERISKTDRLILTSQKGRKETYGAKLGVCFCICVLSVVLLNAAEIVVLFSDDLGDLSIPIRSIESFSFVAEDISCIEYILLYFVKRSTIEIISIVLSCIISFYSKSYVSYLGVAVCLILFIA